MSGAWRTLGIARTADATAIRRAYAQALRAMDPDANPQGFADLRAARDEALEFARSAADEEAEPDRAALETHPSISRLAIDALAVPVLDTETAESVRASGGKPVQRPLAEARLDTGAGTSLEVPELSLDAPLIERAGGDVTVLPHPPTAPYDAAYNELLARLQGEEEPDGDRLLELVRFLLDDPRMARLTFAEDAERWFAGVLADAVPRSDPVLALAAERFGWASEVGSIALFDDAERVAERARAIEYWHAAAVPSHPDHRLLAELTRADDTGAPWRSLLIRRATMRNYLARIRTSYPDVEAWLEPQRLGFWDRPRVGGPGWSAWGIGLFVLLRLLIAIFESPSHEQANPPIHVTSGPTIVSSFPRDANMALLNFADGFTLDRTRRENPALAKAIEVRWQDASAQRLTLARFARDTGTYLRTRFAGSVLRAPYPAIAALRRLDLAELDTARALGADACAQYLDGDLPIERVRSRTDEQMRRRMMADILLGDPIATRRRNGATFTIPGSVMERIARSARLDRKALDAALDRRGPAGARCDARRALLTVALDLPTEAGLPLLRAM